jgi:UDP-GlcNAc:undecaprenyl-phosphate GlcNAc-1-phosphate transferase
MNVHVIAFLVSFAFSLLLTPFSIVLARRFGLIAYPDPRGWHQKPTPLLGGAALWGSFLAGWLLTSHELSQWRFLLAGAILSFLLGLIDDLIHLKPPIKLLGQLGVVWLVMPHHSVISLLFVLLMMNSLNLLDNIDGLAGGIACIISLGLACFGFLYGRPEIISPSLSLAGATAGFLVYNFHPAKIFMGDCGSLMLGFLLGAIPSTPFSVHGIESSTLVLLFFVPLSDTLFVCYRRLKIGRSVVAGGQDHLSHWFLSRGFSPRKTVLILYGITLSANLIGLCLMRKFIKTL